MYILVNCIINIFSVSHTIFFCEGVKNGFYYLEWGNKFHFMSR